MSIPNGDAMGFILWIIALVATTLGVVLGDVVVSLNIIGNNQIINAIFWFLISMVTYYAGRKMKDEKWYKLLSLNFLITWAFSTIGALLGNFVWTLIDTGNASLNLNSMIDLFFIVLPLCIGPTAAMSLGLRDTS